MKRVARAAVLAAVVGLGVVGGSVWAAGPAKNNKGPVVEVKDGVLARTGKVLFEDNFQRGDMKPKWRVGKGSFVIKDGVVTATENPDDKHAAYAYLQPNFVFKDIVVEFSVKIDGGKACHLMINDNKYQGSHAGHILKASVLAGNKLNLSDWKFGAMKNEIFEKMKDEKTPAEEKAQLRASIKDKSADFPVEGAVDVSEWHVVRVEVAGDEMLMSIDGKPRAYLKSEGVAHPTKNAIGFEVGGKSAEIKDVKVWEAAPSPEWASKREAVVAGLKG